MQSLDLFALGAERSRWLAGKVDAIARNVANADTPGYVARDVPPFDNVLAQAGIILHRTNVGHLAFEERSASDGRLSLSQAIASKHSGNTVNLEDEMARLGDARSRQSMVSGILAAFHQMVMSSS